MWDQVIDTNLSTSADRAVAVTLPEAGVIRQNLDLTQFGAEIQMPTAVVTILQTGDAGDGLLRDWPPVNMGVEKNYGYAFQWFGLSALLVILYVWFQIVRRFI